MYACMVVSPIFVGLILEKGAEENTGDTSVVPSSGRCRLHCLALATHPNSLRLLSSCPSDRHKLTPILFAWTSLFHSAMGKDLGSRSCCCLNGWTTVHPPRHPCPKSYLGVLPVKVSGHGCCRSLCTQQDAIWVPSARPQWLQQGS